MRKDRVRASRVVMKWALKKVIITVSYERCAETVLLQPFNKFRHGQLLLVNALFFLQFETPRWLVMAHSPIHGPRALVSRCVSNTLFGFIASTFRATVRAENSPLLLFLSAVLFFFFLRLSPS